MKKVFLKVTCLMGAVSMISAVNAAYAQEMQKISDYDGSFALQSDQGEGLPSEKYIVKFLSQKAMVQKNTQDSEQSDRVAVERLAGKWYSVDSKGMGRDEVLQKISNIGKVEYIEADIKRKKAAVHSDSLSSQEYLNWGIGSSGFDLAVDEISSVDPDSEVVVAVLDTGVWGGHPLLMDRMVEGYDFFDDDSDPSDTDGHGTHVAGIVASATDGLPVKIMPVRVMDSDGGYDSIIGEGMKYAVDNGADVINMSLTGPGSSAYLESMVEYANSNGVVVVVSAGNDSDDTAQYYPAGIVKCITVSATDKYDGFAGFSNFGQEVDVAAPGVDIVSSTILRADKDGIKDGYTSMEGTSMSAPFVAAAASILKLDDEKLLPYEIEYLLKRNVRDAGAVGDDPYFGEGIIDYKKWLSSGNFGAEGRIELVNGPKSIFSGSSFLIKYRAKEGYKPSISVEYNGETLESQVEYPEEGYAGVVMAEKLPAGIVTVNVDYYSYEAFVQSEQGEFSFTPDSEILISFLEAQPIDEIHRENLYIRGPDGYRMDFENIETVDGGIKARLGSGSGLSYGRCSIVMERLKTDSGELDQIIPARLYYAQTGL